MNSSWCHCNLRAHQLWIAFRGSGQGFRAFSGASTYSGQDSFIALLVYDAIHTFFTKTTELERSDGDFNCGLWSVPINIIVRQQSQMLYDCRLSQFFCPHGLFTCIQLQPFHIWQKQNTGEKNGILPLADISIVHMQTSDCRDRCKSVCDVREEWWCSSEGLGWTALGLCSWILCQGSLTHIGTIMLDYLEMGLSTECICERTHFCNPKSSGESPSWNCPSSDPYHYFNERTQVFDQLSSHSLKFDVGVQVYTIRQMNILEKQIQSWNEVSVSATQEDGSSDTSDSAGSVTWNLRAGGQCAAAGTELTAQGAFHLRRPPARWITSGMLTNAPQQAGI